jgi:hypothetical protein
MNGNGPTNGNGTAVKTLRERAGDIRSREDFVQFARALVANLRESPDEWTNADLAAYLEALGAWVDDLDGYYQNRGEPVPDQPTWRTLGEILGAAKVYE